MIKSGGGSIINMSSIVALKALPGRDCYTAAKGAIAALTRSMAVEYAAHKIRVNAIAPGVVLTDRVKKLMEAPRTSRSSPPRMCIGLGLPDPHGRHGGLSRLRRGGDHHRAGHLGRQRGDDAVSGDSGGILT